MKIAAGAIACDKLRDRAPMERKNMDMVTVQTNVNRKNTKKWPGVRRRFVMKYTVRSNTIVVPILFGKSVIIDAIVMLATNAFNSRTGGYVPTASENG